jgi:hypothetical protein
VNWLWILVVLQVAIPASYYLVRDDPDDERFAWRMFSAVRLKRCEVTASERASGGLARPIDIPRSVHASWIRSLERGRPNVIEHFLAQRCRPTPGAAAIEDSELTRRCKGAAGRALPSSRYRYDCASRRLETGP